MAQGSKLNVHAIDPSLHVFFTFDYISSFISTSSFTNLLIQLKLNLLILIHLLTYWLNSLTINTLKY